MRWWLCWALLAGAVTPLRAASLPSVSAAAFAAQVSQAQRLAEACSGNAAACDGASLPPREQVSGFPRGSFTMNWDWLREDLASAKAGPGPERAKRMQATDAHLLALLSEAGEHDAVTPQVGRARAAADAALAREEFRAAGGPTWWQRVLARLQDAFLRLFTGMDRLGRRAPWLAPLIEWGCFALAAGGLLWFVRQSLARQALRISLSESQSLGGVGERSGPDWAGLAEERAAAGDWRAATHFLYWAAVALLDTRRAWKPNVTRTPREALRLLKPGSPAHSALRELTVAFEGVWYGNASADAAGYDAALRSFRMLQETRLERFDGSRDRDALAPQFAAEST